ncbi:HAD family hydrolase [Microbacterium sp. KUDC0406]|uniref:HAD family hydrolase n=1 Tax=Microbacterium sp. KUDC0406 TaxID=2909588 RepID=UPI001F45D189|nr:HAD-IA family hydrolase [Microbacterium sp. KUDC0406]UJP08838.1 HAD family hydrolase [Microbacterium sp. KUDC0406]
MATGDRRVVFWDFDGTLAVREGMWSAAVADALRSVDATIAVDPELVRPHLRSGFPWHEPEVMTSPPPSADAWTARLAPVFTRALSAQGVPEDVASAASARVLDEYYRHEPWRVVDGATEALRLVADAGYDNVILSNHGPGLPTLVDALGLSPLITLTITSAAVGIEKPNPLLFTHALRVTDAGADTWMVGDNPVADVEGAQRAGIRALLADGIYPDSRGLTVLQAARHIAAAAS